MLTSDFDFTLPPECIAQTPAEPRDSSKLMVVQRGAHTVAHAIFRDIVGYLQEGDLLVWNNSKVFKARLTGEIVADENVLGASGDVLPRSAVEIFLVRPMENAGVWKVLAKPARKLRLGMKIWFAEDFMCEVLLKEDDGTLLVQFEDEDFVVREKANHYGEVPLPPYISKKQENEKTRKQDDEERYQTVYAQHEGSVAAPTAGFHFTPELIEQLNKKGVQFAEVTLHVGLGTFLPVKAERIEDHVMHNEWVELTDKNAGLINSAKAEGRRVVAVGTTTVRTLEGIAKALESRKLQAYTGDINIFITPGFQFQIIDALITNFHLPKSTLLMLVSAFVGDKQFVLEYYQKAIAAQYRFYSFGDAMLIT